MSRLAWLLLQREREDTSHPPLVQSMSRLRRSLPPTLPPTPTTPEPETEPETEPEMEPEMEMGMGTSLVGLVGTMGMEMMEGWSLVVVVDMVAVLTLDMVEVMALDMEAEEWTRRIG